MENIQLEILERLSYDGLDYEKINQNMGTNYSDEKIRSLILAMIMKSESYIVESHRNYYIGNNNYNVEIIIDKNIYRVKTINKL